MKMTGKRSKNLIAFLFQDQNFKIDKLKAKAKQKKKKGRHKKNTDKQICNIITT